MKPPTDSVLLTVTLDKHSLSRMGIILPDLSSKALNEWAEGATFNLAVEQSQLAFHHLYFKHFKQKLTQYARSVRQMLLPWKKMIYFTCIRAWSFKDAEHPTFARTSMDAYQLSAGVQGIRELAHYFATSCSINLFQKRSDTEIYIALERNRCTRRKNNENWYMKFGEITEYLGKRNHLED